MTSENIAISPAQVRAARSLIGWSQKALADAAGVGISTVADYEREARIPVRQNLVAIRRALEEANVVFIETGGTAAVEDATGIGVRLRR